MIFRARGKKTYVIRTVYSKEKGRGEQVTVCKIVTNDIEFLSIHSEEIESQLVESKATEEEISEIKGWLDATQKYLLRESCQNRAGMSLNFLKSVNRSLNEKDIMNFITEDMADDIFAEMKLIRDHLREAGHKEKRAKKTK